ncbi:MAG: hypothetical protein ABJA33_06225 [Pedococcus sp.]
MPEATNAQPVRRTRIRPLTLAVVVALMMSASAGFVFVRDLGDATASASTPGIVATRTDSSKLPPEPGPSATVGARSSGAVSEAERIRALDPVQVARSVASDDAAARPGAVPSSAVKGVWRVGKVGTYLVGKGIAPGTYESAGATEGQCQWSRLRDLGAKPTSVVQRGSGSGKSVVTISSSDAFFETSGCQNWHKVG